MTEPQAPGPDLRRLVGLDPNMTQGLPPVDHIKILRGDHPDQAAYEAVYEVIDQYPPLAGDEFGKAVENARVWRGVQGALAVANVQRDRLAGRIRAALDLHKPMRIYGECGHTHQSGDPGTVDVDDVGVVCEDGFETTICRECCAGGVSQSEQCADEHRHSTGPCWPCPTYRALDVDAVAGLVERSSLGSPDAVAARGQVHPETGRVLAHASVRLAEIAAERDRIAVLDHATRFEFSDLPVGHPLRPAWAVDAVLCGSGTWEVRRGSWRLSRDGKWSTGDGFSVEHQFDLDTALVVAKQAAHEMTIGTYTAAEVLAADEEGDGDD